MVVALAHPRLLNHDREGRKREHESVKAGALHAWTPTRGGRRGSGAGDAAMVFSGEVEGLGFWLRREVVRRVLERLITLAFTCGPFKWRKAQIGPIY